jgi:hypothetical protein
MLDVQSGRRVVQEAETSLQKSTLNASLKIIKVLD